MAGDEFESRTLTRLDVMILARFSREEAAALRAAAERAGMGVSAYLRQAALAASATNIVDLDRASQDIARVKELASDALRVLA